MFIIILTATSQILALEITEVELNPEGQDLGNEWIELYSEEEINLQSYIIQNNDGDTIDLSDTFSSYHIINLEKQWLDNSDEKVILKKGEEIIAETPIFKDSSNNNLSWNLCSGEWLFVQSSKGNENNCKGQISTKDSMEEEKSPNKKPESPNNKQTSLIEQQNTQDNSKIVQTEATYQTKEQQEPIQLLNSPFQPIEEENPPTTFKTKKEKTIQIVSLSFTAFTLIIVILLALRKL